MVFKTDYRLMQVKSIAECSKVPSVFYDFCFVYFEWPLKTGFTVPFFIVDSRYIGNLVDSEDQDEISNYPAFHQGAA